MGKLPYGTKNEAHLLNGPSHLALLRKLQTEVEDGSN